MDEELGQKLLEQAVAGEQPALERLLFMHYDRLARRMARKIPALLRGTMSEEDVLQQTFVTVFQRITSFEPRGERAFFRWIATIADNQLLDAIKAQKAQKRGGDRAQVRGGVDGHSESVDELVFLLAGSEPTPSRVFARKEAIAAIHVGLASVGEDYRKAIELRYFRGMTVADVAKVVGRSPHAIHNLCHRGLKALRLVMGRSSQFLSRG